MLSLRFVILSVLYATVASKIPIIPCATRHKSSPCSTIKDRITCLSTTESRSGVISGVQLYGTECAWCPNGPCTGNNNNKCESSNWLVANGVSEFDTCLEAPDVCPSGYERRNGDISGWGSDIGTRLSLTREECANACNDHALCLSFEHSNTALLCNLNKIAEPTTGANYGDYAFCKKTVACPSDWTQVGGTSFSPPRKTHEWKGSGDCNSNCAAVEQLCTDVGATLATKEETHAWLDNGGDRLGMTYGLTSTMNGNQHWFTQDLGDHGWYDGCCDHKNRFFVCAKPLVLENMSLDLANSLIQAGLQEAKKMELRMSIAVMDSATHLVSFIRMDDSLLASLDISMKKAKTAVLFNAPSSVIGQLSQPGGIVYGVEQTNGGLVLFGGGFPIHNKNGRLIGGIGVSGGSVTQDEQVAEAAMNAAKCPISRNLEENMLKF